MDQKERAAAYNAAVQRMNDAADAVQALGDDAADDDLTAAEDTFETAMEEVERCRRNMERADEIAQARAENPLIDLPADKPADKPELRAKVGNEEKTYRPDTTHQRSFLADILLRKNGDRAAADRLERNRLEALDAMGHLDQFRDMSNASTAGEDFLPPLYLADLWVGPAVAGRPFANVLPTMPLPPYGTDISIPHLSSGVAVAARADAGAVQETDGVTASITHDVNEIAGQVDIGRIAVMRSFPGLDNVIGQTLVKRYHAYLDTQLLSGTGTAPQHRGIRVVSGANTSTYTAATPAQTGLIPKLYDAIQQNWDGRKGESQPDTIVYHPRRAGWLAAALSSSVPLFPQSGAGVNGLGDQTRGFLVAPLGLREVVDPNVGTTYGASTNEDEIYIVNSDDLILMEGPLMARVFDDVGSGNGLIRYQVFAHSAFLSKRYPEAIAIVSGTGLAAPTF